MVLAVDNAMIDRYNSATTIDPNIVKRVALHPARQSSRGVMFFLPGVAHIAMEIHLGWDLIITGHAVHEDIVIGHESPCERLVGVYLRSFDGGCLRLFEVTCLIAELDRILQRTCKDYRSLTTLLVRGL